MAINVLTGQSLFDLAMQELGSVEGVFELAEKADVSLTDELAVGVLLNVPVDPLDRQVVDYYKANGITPATAITKDNTSGGGDISMEGIEFWAVEYDFIVS